MQVTRFLPLCALLACVPPAGSTTTLHGPTTPATRAPGRQTAAKEGTGALRTIVPLPPRAPVGLSLFGGAFRSAIESEGPVREEHDPAGLHATFVPALPVPLVCSAHRDGDAPFPTYLASVIQALGQARGRAVVRVEPVREGVFFYVAITVKPPEEAPFVLSAAAVYGDRRSVSCTAFGGASEGDLTRISRGLWDASQWAPASDPEVTTALHFYRVRDGAQTVGFEVRRTFQGTSVSDKERGAYMLEFEFRGRDHDFTPAWRTVTERDDATGQSRELFYGSGKAANEAEYVAYTRKDGSWERQTGAKEVLALPGAPLMGSELGLRESLRGLAFTPDAAPFTYATSGYSTEENGKSVVKFNEVKLSVVRPGVLDEEVSGDHDRLLIDREGVVVRETHFVKDGDPADDEHVREITERISHYVRAGSALVSAPE